MAPSPLRVAYLVSRYPAVSHTFVLTEVAALRARGVEVDTISIRRAHREHLLTDADREAARTTYAVLPPRPHHLLAAHLRALAASPRGYLATLALALRLSPPGARAALWQLFYFVEAMVVWWRLRRRGITHVHAHFANVSASVALLVAHFGTLASPAGPWTWSFTMHGPTELYDVERHGLPDKVRRAAFVACISDFARSQLMGLSEPEHWDRLRVVHCGVDLSAFAPGGEGEARGEGGLTAVAPDPGPPLRVVTVGRLVAVKGHAVLLEALAELRRRGRPVRAVLVGDGPEEGHLRALVARLGLEDLVELAGALGHDAVRAELRGADVVCLPSFAEGVPVSLMEAMALERPVVSTRIMGIPELIDDGADGLLVRPARADELVTALAVLLDDPELRRELGRAARRKVAAEFRIEQTAEGVHALLGAAVSGTGAVRGGCV